MKMKEAIRLTNKTAIAIRKNAQKVRTAYFAAAIIISVLLGAAGIVLGLVWLGAVPFTIVLICLIDGALMLASRSRYLSLLGQAICTEAAAREIHAGRSESLRREQAISDLMRMQADMNAAKEKAPGAQPFFEAKDESAQNEEDAQNTDRPEESGVQQTARRRRRQANLQLIKSSEAK